MEFGPGDPGSHAGTDVRVAEITRLEWVRHSVNWCP